MKVIVCLDDNGGMLFNNRRQSRDKLLLSDIVKRLGGKKLVVPCFSEKLFSDFREYICVDDDYLNGEYKGCVLFLENSDPAAFADRISEITVYKWNRTYPSDLKCTLDFSLFNLVSEEAFKGFSHEKITRQVYIRK